MSDDYLWDRSGPPDPDIAKLESLLKPLAHDAPINELRMRRKRRPPWVVLGFAVAAAAALVIYFALPRDHAQPCRGGAGFKFTGEGGAVSCGGVQVAEGVLPVGGELDTGAHRAELMIADIGTAKLGPNTQIKLARTDAQRHQLTLERGHMHAKVIAVPRLFAVSTKHTDVVDLGCEYTIDVDEAGAGVIRVMSGMVELATKTGAIVVVPQGTHAALLAGQRPGLPIGRGASEQVQTAVRAYDRGEAGAFEALLAAARDRDAITLIALADVDVGRRTSVLTRLAELSPPPDAEITPEIAAQDPKQLAIWRTDIIEIYIGVWSTKP